jgi:hypothetical protein
MVHVPAKTPTEIVTMLYLDSFGENYNLDLQGDVRLESGEHVRIGRGLEDCLTPGRAIPAGDYLVQDTKVPGPEGAVLYQHGPLTVAVNPRGGLLVVREYSLSLAREDLDE